MSWRVLLIQMLLLGWIGSGLAWAQSTADPIDAIFPAADTPELMLYKDMPMVVAAGKREQSQQQAAASVSVIDAEQIELFGYRSLADVLRNQRSFFLHTDGLNWFAGVRGFLRPGEWNARILVLVDGRPTRDPIFGQTHLDPDFVVPMEAIQRVEVVRGPGSALYGSGAVFGVINIVTKNAADVAGNGQVKVQGGTKQTARGSALVASKLADGWEILGSAAGFTTQGDKDIKYDDVHDAARNFGHIKDFDAENAGMVFLKARKNDFTIEMDYARREKDNRSATYLASWFDPGRMQEERGNATLRYDHEVETGQSLHAMVFFGHYQYRQNWMYDDDGAGHPYRYFTEAESDWVGGETHYDWQVSKAIHLTLGLDAMQSLVTRQHDHDSISGNLLDNDPGTDTFGAFGEGEVKVTDWLTLTGGIRLDYVQRIGTQLSPRAAAIISPTKQDTVKALYGRAFRAPNLYEMFYASPQANTPNPDLQPELVDTYELVWERQFQSGWRTSLGYYLWKMSNAMDGFQLPDQSLQTRNGGRVVAQGVELELQKRWNSGAGLRTYGSLGRANRDGEQLTHSPEWILGAAAVLPILGRKTFLSIEPQVIGPMKADFGQSTEATFITNIVLTSRDLFKGWDLQVGAYNLFAHDARLPRDDVFNQSQPWLRYPGTEALVSLSYRF